VRELQREWYWVIVLVMFFLEREMILDTMFMALSIAFEIFK
jgi:hypothetical protein